MKKNFVFEKKIISTNPVHLNINNIEDFCLGGFGIKLKVNYLHFKYDNRTHEIQIIKINDIDIEFKKVFANVEDEATNQIEDFIQNNDSVNEISLENFQNELKKRIKYFSI